jgi:excinuclease UvrABC nuclease subunit
MNLKDILKISKLGKIKFKPIDFEDHVDGGIYRLFDSSGEVIYVGKSLDLKRRLRQHLGKDTNTAYFIDEVKKAEWLVEPDPVFQGMLEGIFIAYHRPKYNDEVKDAKKKFGDDYDKTCQ